MFQYSHLLHYIVVGPVGIASSMVGLKICALTAGIKKYKSVIKNNALLREYNGIKEEIKDLRMLWNMLYKNNGNALQNTANKNSSVRRTKQNRLTLVWNWDFWQEIFLVH